MFHKVHLRLTLLCAGITTLIMVIMSLSYLYVSEKGLNRSQFLSFKSDMNTIITNLEQQNVISFEWLSKMEAQSQYIISILDNDVPFLYNTLKNTPDNSHRELLVSEGLAAFDAAFSGHSLPNSSTLSPYMAYHVEYEFTSPSTGREYYGCVAILARDDSILQVVILASLDSLNIQIREQRIRFLFIDLFSIIALTGFSWFFTWILLKPIEENRRQQVQFIASASHELRTPLAVILSCASACQSAPAAKANNFLGIIEEESRRMSGLIEDMLTLTKADNHSWNMHPEEIQPDTLLLNAYETFQPMAAEKKLRFRIHLPDMPLLYLSCDKLRMEQVLAILLHNAVSYTPADGQITLGMRLTKQWIGFTVADTGCGIPDQEKDKIFRRFYRIEKARNTKGHSGLGLSIAAEIVRAHNGSIKVMDNPEGGTVFEIRLPY